MVSFFGEKTNFFEIFGPGMEIYKGWGQIPDGYNEKEAIDYLRYLKNIPEAAIQIPNLRIIYFAREAPPRHYYYVYSFPKMKEVNSHKKPLFLKFYQTEKNIGVTHIK
jgi:hypothetical protein